MRRAAELFATDQQFRNAVPLPNVTAAIQRSELSLLDIVEAVMLGYADRPALGERMRERITDPTTGRTTLRLVPRFETVTFADLWARAGAIAAEWYRNPRSPLRPGERVCTRGFTSVDYTVLDMACLRLGAVAVPLQNSASVGHLTPIITEVEPRILATSLEQLSGTIACLLASRSTSVRRVIVFDYDPEVDEHRETFAAASESLAKTPIALEPLSVVLQRGRTLAPAPSVAADADRLAMLIYTSGSTGTPKGAMYTERLVANLWSGAAPMPSIGLNYMPMSHAAARVAIIRTLATGGTSYFTARSDLSTLFEDMSLARPTEVMFVPRVCDMLFQRYRNELERRGSDDAMVQAEVKKDLREKFLGGRLLLVLSGSAPLSAFMAEFVESCLDMPLHDGFAATETGLLLFDRKIARPPVIDYKLVDVPGLGYFSTDTPHPRGELLVKTSSMVPGYYKRPELNAELFDADGYYHTGDIMAEIGPDELVYVDRTKNVLKLSQGEFVAISRLETLFATSMLIRQIFVYGNSKRPYLLAVVVPTDAVLRGGAAAKSWIAESLRQIAAESGLSSYEIPRDVLIEPEPFSVENGLLSDMRKPLRPRLTQHYGPRLEQLYAELAEREASELHSLRQSGREQPVFDTVVRAAHAVLSASSDVGPDSRFSDLGGDSLSALSLANLLTEIYGVDVPVSAVLSPAGSLRSLAERISSMTRAQSSQPTFAAVHGSGAAEVRARDLSLDKFLGPASVAAARALAGCTSPARTVLLTGANGYLGRFLCLEWLERAASRGGRLICVLRGRDAAEARARLEAVFDSGDPELLQRFQMLAADHLEVLAGDIAEANLGLDAATWQRFADTVDLVVHPAALVNHVLPYEQLFGPNVCGTAEVIRLAITARLKPIVYVSTMGVHAGQPSAADEDLDIRIASPVRPLHDGYASGYASSKWAGEVLLREVHDATGLPVAVFRSDMILAHSRYSGQLNVPDIFTRLLISLIVTGIAPRSFYERDMGSAHYTGLPVDFIAEAIATLGEQATTGYRTFNVLNPHDDGICLDTFVDWLGEAGHPIARIEKYQDWFARFETAIRALPERQKPYTVLPLLHAFAQSAEANLQVAPSAKRFSAAVRSAKLGPEDDIPHITAALIGKYVSDLRALRLISA